MKKLLILITFLSSLIYAQNCRPIDEEDKILLKKDYEYTVIVKSGVVCNDLIYWQGYTTRNKTEVCEIINFNINTKEIVLGNTYSYYHFDKFGILDDQSIKENSNMDCIDLYKLFKKTYRIK